MLILPQNDLLDSPEILGLFLESILALFGRKIFFQNGTVFDDVIILKSKLEILVQITVKLFLS